MDVSGAVASVRAMLLRKTSATEPIPDAWPLIAWAKLPSVGCDGARSGVSEKISCDGLNAVDIIHAIGNSVTRATSTPVPLRLTVLSLFRAAAWRLMSVLPAGRRRGRSRPSQPPG